MFARCLGRLYVTLTRPSKSILFATLPSGGLDPYDCLGCALENRIGQAHLLQPRLGSLVSVSLVIQMSLRLAASGPIWYAPHVGAGPRGPKGS